MCYILAYVIFVLIAKELAARFDNPSISTATSLAPGVVASFNPVYPSPVVISAAEELSANADRLFILGFLSRFQFPLQVIFVSDGWEKPNLKAFLIKLRKKS